jgi:endonuclease/exonuclease/phosphatase family metal-dependent hydrolase
MPAPEPLRIVSFNTAAFLSVGAAVRDVRAVADRGVDVIALQEMASAKRRAAVRAALVDCETCVFEMFAPTNSGAVSAGTPILYRSDRFWLLASGSVQVTKATYVGPRGAGPSTIRPKFVNWVRLRDRLTRRQVYVLNNHTVPSVQARNGGPNANKARLRVYRKHMSGLKALIVQSQQTGGTIFVTGDFNVNYRKDRIVAASMFPYRSLSDVAVRASYQRLGEPRTGTHILPSGNDERLIDYVFIRDHRAVTPVRQEIITGVSSDHRPILVEVGLAYRPRFFR